MNLPKAKILLVDDDITILELLGSYLTGLGYEVCTTNQAGHALSEVGKDPHFDLLISDIVMPEMEGHELANLLRSRNPDLRVILISGYSDAVVEVTPRVRFLRKPFRLQQLVDTIADVLAADNVEDTNPQIAVYFEHSQGFDTLSVGRRKAFGTRDTSETRHKKFETRSRSEDRTVSSDSPSVFMT